jgi:hypothetical protein
LAALTPIKEQVGYLFGGRNHDGIDFCVEDWGESEL